MSRVNLKHIISQQAPEFIRSDSNYANFISFLESYYDFLNTQDNTNLNQVRDIDYGLTAFISNFRAELNLDNLKYTGSNELLFKHIRDIYEAKGSEQGFRTLFRVLFNKSIEIEYPSEQIFKPSGAKWNRDVAIRFTIDTGLLNSFENVFATITTPTKQIPVNISRIRRVNNSITIYEAVLDIKSKLELPTGGTISTSSFTGTLVTTTTYKKVKNPGTGFVVGDIYQIITETGTGTRIKVTGVTSTSGLKSFDIVEFGVNYASDFNYEIYPLNAAAIQRPPNLNITVTDSGSVVVSSSSTVTDDNINTLQDNLMIVKQDYLSDPTYLQDNTYVGSILNTTSTDTISIAGDTPAATILFELGYVLTYVGYYSTTVGFPDDASYIQDGNYYQQFSYVTKTNIQYSEYESAIKSLVHPAGTKLFGEYDISTNQDILISIYNILNRIDSDIYDEINISDGITSKSILKNLIDTTTNLEVITKTISRTLEETTTLTDEQIKSITKNIVDLISVSDTIEQKEVSKNISDTVSIFEVVTINGDTYVN